MAKFTEQILGRLVCDHIHSRRNYSSSVIFSRLNLFYEDRKAYLHQNVTLVTFLSDDLLPGYGAYSLSINALYASRKGYPFYIFTPNTSIVFDPIDYRWSRVKIFDWLFSTVTENQDCTISNSSIPCSIVNTSSSEVSSSSYFVWLDADLIILDFDFDIVNDVIFHDTRTRQADLIISAEYHAETGVANTGCFVMRNTAWSREFIAKWWNNDDQLRASAHDQIFFDRLYKKLLIESAAAVHDHIVILPTRFLNSMPPAILAMEISDRVLHLMGSKNSLRTKLFRYGLTQYCLLPSPSSVSRPLGLVPATVFQLSLEWYLEELLVAMKEIKALEISILDMEGQCCDEFEVLLGSVGDARELVLQLHKMQLRLTSTLDLSQPLREMFATSLSALSVLQSSQGLSKQSLTYRLRFNDLCALLGNDLILSLASSSRPSSLTEQLDVTEKVEQCLQAVENSVDSRSLPAVLAMKAIFLQNKAQLFITMAQSQSMERMQRGEYYRRAVATFRRAEDIFWSELPPEEANPFQKAASALSLGRSLCESFVSTQEEFLQEIDDVVYGLEALQRAVALIERLLFAEEQLKEDHVRYFEALTSTILCSCRVYTVIRSHNHVEKVNVTYRPNLLGWIDISLTKLKRMKMNFCTSRDSYDICSKIDLFLTEYNDQNCLQERSGPSRLKRATKKVKLTRRHR